jgi:phenylacetate-CoA ligase
MEKPRGRTDDMIIVNGVNIYPSTVAEVLDYVNGASPHFMMIVSKKGALDELEIQIEVSEALFFDEMKKQKQLLEELVGLFQKAILIKPKIKLVMPSSLERFEGKAKRVVDNRMAD